MLRENDDVWIQINPWLMNCTVKKDKRLDYAFGNMNWSPTGGDISSLSFAVICTSIA
jgi:hypothetical protein